jgi:hypothetical protein
MRNIGRISRVVGMRHLPLQNQCSNHAAGGVILRPDSSPPQMTFVAKWVITSNGPALSAKEDVQAAGKDGQFT